MCIEGCQYKNKNKKRPAKVCTLRDTWVPRRGCIEGSITAYAAHERGGELSVGGSSLFSRTRVESEEATVGGGRQGEGKAGRVRWFELG